MPSFLITGASRGIGLALVGALLKDSQNLVIATARDPVSATGIQALASKFPKSQFRTVTLDVTSSNSIADAVKEVSSILGKDGLDVFVPNAGINLQGDVSFEDMDLDKLRDELSFNTVSLVETTRAFLPLIRAGKEKKMLFLTSQVGSLTIGPNLPGLANPYCISKAALNMVVRKWTPLLKAEGIVTKLVHPGWVSTDIGDTMQSWFGKYAPQLKQITVEQSAEGLVKVLDSMTIEETGKFVNYDGNEIPF